jgi:hypothetical protein
MAITRVDLILLAQLLRRPFEDRPLAVGNDARLEAEIDREIAVTT